jgi:hypothetical protein
LLFSGVTGWFLSLVVARKSIKKVEENTQEQAIQENGQVDNIIQCHHLKQQLSVATE